MFENAILWGGKTESAAGMQVFFLLPWSFLHVGNAFQKVLHCFSFFRCWVTSWARTTARFERLRLERANE